MKSLILKLIPGAVATVAVLILGAFAVHAQQTTNAPAAAPVVQAPPAAVDQGGQPYIICGVCGARILAPQVVQVAAPYYVDGGGYACGYRIPAAPVFSLTDYWRADPRLIQPTFYPQLRPLGPVHPQRRFR